MASHTDDLRWDRRLWLSLILLCGVLFLDGLDVSMVGMALPSIRDDLGLSTSQLQWVVSGYVLGYGGLLLLGGRAADLLGRKRTLIGGLAVFFLASLLGGLASDPTVLVATRFVKGAAAAFTAPASLSLITTTFAEGPARNKALSVYTACGASGFSFGLILGGLMTEVGWRYTFLLPVPFALAILILAPRVLRSDHDQRRPEGSFDIPGALTITAGMLLLVRSVVRAPAVGWGSVETLASFVVAFGLLTAFVWIERRSRHPLVRLGILRSGSLVRANIGAMTTFGGYASFQFLATLFLQNELGWSALHTALAFLPAGLLVAFGSPRVGALVDRFGTQRLIAAGFVAFVVGYALFLRVDHEPAYGAAILPTILLIGFGFALAFPSLSMQATSGIADQEQGLASGLVNTSFQVGGAIVLAIVSAIVASSGTTDFLDAMRPALAVIVGVSVIGLVAAVTGIVGSREAVPATASA
jgi:MFS family permease